MLKKRCVGRDIRLEDNIDQYISAHHHMQTRPTKPYLLKKQTFETKMSFDYSGGFHPRTQDILLRG